MDEFSKIESLISASGAANNYLALQLMMSLLGYSFEEAYCRLKPLCREEEEVFLEIAEIRIVYKVDLQRIIYASSSYADIERNLYYKDNLLPDYKKRLYSDDDSVLSLGEFGTVDQLPEIRDDILALCEDVKELWARMG